MVWFNEILYNVLYVGIDNLSLTVIRDILALNAQESWEN